MTVIKPTAASGLAETILAILPFPEHKPFFDCLRERYPRSKIIYYQPPKTDDVRGVEKYWKNDIPVPEELYQQATILLTLKTLPLPELAPNLHLVHLFSAGLDHITEHPLYTDTAVRFTTSSGIHAPQITEHVLGTLLALTHHIPQLLEWQRESRWGSHSAAGGYFGTVHDLAQKTIGILGYGAIGRQVGRVAKALGMRVLAYTASPKDTPESRRDESYIVPGTGDLEGTVPDAWFHGLDAVSRRAFLAQGIDVLLVAVPLTPQTLGFLGKEEIEILGRPRPGTGRGAYVVNIARGPIVDHEALIEGLKKGLEPGLGGLAGASLDVTDPEPLPSSSELWGMKNVIVTPHVSGVGSQYMERCLEVLEINLKRLDAGEKLVNEVRREKGY